MYTLKDRAHRRALMFIPLLILSGLGPTLSTPILFQPDGKCATLVTEALQAVGTSCSRMGRNEACYGHALVAATFNEPASDVDFQTAGDLANLIELQALATKPADLANDSWGIAMMKVQADLPDEADATLTFVLFGDTEVTNARASSQAAAPTCTVTNAGTSNINVRGGPGTGYGIVDVLASGSHAITNGRNAAGDWVRITLEGDGVGWVYVPLVTVDCAVDTLQLVDSELAPAAYPDMHAMQAFTLRTGPTSECEEAPDGLVIRSPHGERGYVMANGVVLEFVSSAFLTAIPNQALTITGIEGAIKVTSASRTVVVMPGTTVIVPLAGLQAAGPPMREGEVGYRVPAQVGSDTENADTLLVDSMPDTFAHLDITDVESGPYNTTWLIVGSTGWFVEQGILVGDVGSAENWIITLSDDLSSMTYGPPTSPDLFNFERVGPLTYGINRVRERDDGSRRELDGTLTFTSPSSFVMYHTETEYPVNGEIGTMDQVTAGNRSGN